jgi:hypothetical protein
MLSFKTKLIGIYDYGFRSSRKMDLAERGIYFSYLKLGLNICTSLNPDEMKEIFRK